MATSAWLDDPAAPTPSPQAQTPPLSPQPVAVSQQGVPLAPSNPPAKGAPSIETSMPSAPVLPTDSTSTPPAASVSPAVIPNIASGGPHPLDHPISTSQPAAVSRYASFQPSGGQVAGGLEVYSTIPQTTNDQPQHAAILTMDPTTAQLPRKTPWGMIIFGILAIVLVSGIIGTVYMFTTSTKQVAESLNKQVDHINALLEEESFVPKVEATYQNPLDTAAFYENPFTAVMNPFDEIPE